MRRRGSLFRIAGTSDISGSALGAQTQLVLKLLRDDEPPPADGAEPAPQPHEVELTRLSVVVQALTRRIMRLEAQHDRMTGMALQRKRLGDRAGAVGTMRRRQMVGEALQSCRRGRERLERLFLSIQEQLANRRVVDAMRAGNSALRGLQLRETGAAVAEIMAEMERHSADVGELSAALSESSPDEESERELLAELDALRDPSPSTAPSRAADPPQKSGGARLEAEQARGRTEGKEGKEAQAGREPEPRTQGSAQGGTQLVQPPWRPAG